ncbi:MAG: nucleotidyltransferase domain-containing protein [Actinobacteria bacterium]|nr:nucleotidyltransferase domain-containing protein [Actinomycetota bacterium]
MNKIFSTKERIRILNSIILNKNPLSVNTIASTLKLSKGLVSLYFDVLKKSGITKKVNEKYLVINSGMTKAIRILLTISGIDASIFKKYDFVKSVGLYGSCSKGENTEESGTDIWIVVSDVEDEKIASLTSEINKKIKRAKPLFITEKKLEKIKKDDELFYHSLSFGSIVLFGEKYAI